MNNFDKNWRNAKKCIFRLEGRPEYKDAREQENLKKWKLGELDLAGDKEWQGWLKALNAAKTKGLAVQRVRAVPKILPDYIKFEIELWQKYSVKSGEEIFLLDEDEYQAIIAEFGFGPKDFWLFDDDKLLILNYGKAGQFLGDILIANGGMIKRYCDLKTKLLQKSAPLNLFLKRI